MFFTKKKLVIVICLMIVSVVSCDNLANDSVENPLIEAEIFEKNIEGITIEPEDEKNLNGSYNVAINLSKEISGKNLPDHLRFMGMDGVELSQKVSGDNISYSAKISNSKIRKGYEKRKNAMSSDPEVSIGCSISVTTPGEYDENCEEECSEESLLGGDTWFCVCFYDCEFEITW